MPRAGAAATNNRRPLSLSLFARSLLLADLTDIYAYKYTNNKNSNNIIPSQLWRLWRDAGKTGLSILHSRRLRSCFVAAAAAAACVVWAHCNHLANKLTQPFISWNCFKSTRLPRGRSAMRGTVVVSFICTNTRTAPDTIAVERQRLLCCCRC